MGALHICHHLVYMSALVFNVHTCRSNIWGTAHSGFKAVMIQQGIKHC